MAPGRCLRISISALLLATCSLSAARAAHAASLHLERADRTTIEYHLEHREAHRRQSLLLLLQGSGCDPVGTDAGVLSTAKLLAPRAATLRIEKYGVEASASVFAQSRAVRGATGGATRSSSGLWMRSR
jgi:hypothetical protein